MSKKKGPDDMWTRDQVAKTIDHAVLKPFATDGDVIAGCRLGKAYGVASVCVRPSDVGLAAKELAGSDVLPSAVVGFPHGAHRPEATPDSTRSNLPSRFASSPLRATRGHVS